MATVGTALADREFWLRRRTELAAAARSVMETLGHRGNGLPSVAERGLPAPTVARLDRVTGGDPVLCWSILAGATALALRRFGATGPVVVVTGAPVAARVPVLLTVSPSARFRDWLTTVLDATGDALDHDRVDAAVLRDCVGDQPPVLELTGGRIVVRSTGALLDRLADAVATVLARGLAEPDVRLADIPVVDDPIAPSERDPTAVPDDVLRAAIGVAHRLRTEGVRPGDVVTLAMPDDERAALTAYGVLLAGAVYLPSRGPAHRIGRVLDELPPPGIGAGSLEPLVAGGPACLLPSGTRLVCYDLAAVALPPVSAYRPYRADRRTYVLDEDLQQVPPGITGAVYVGGTDAPRCYLDDPAATAEDFVPDPFWTPGGRMYRTGERGRRRADGSVEFVGGVAVVRGRTVRLDVLEDELRARPGITAAAVEPVGDRLVAFVVGADATTDAGLGEVTDVQRVAALPTHPHGGVDRRALRAIAADPVAEDHLPRTATERMLAELWEQHLGLADIGVDEDFFELGGDSIIGIRIVQEARRRGYPLRPRHVLEHRTIATLAPVADQARSSDVVSGPSEDGPDPVAPLTPAQAAFFARDLARHDHWNNSLRYELPETVPMARVVDAVGRLAARHPALRTRFTPHQRIGVEPPRTVEIDLRDVPPADALARMHDAACDLHRSLDLRDGPIGWFAVVRMPTGRPDQLVVILHHAVVDLYSWDVLTEDLAILLRGEEPTAPGTSYPDWARRLAEFARTHPDRFDVTYWLDQDWSCSVPVVPWGERGREGAALELVRSLDIGPEQRGYRRLVGALGIALGHWLGHDTGAVPVLLGGHGRQDVFADVDLSRTVGWFTTTYPFLLPLDRSDPDLDAVPRHGFDYTVLRYLSADPESRARLARVPRPQVLFDFTRAAAFSAGRDAIGPLGPASTADTGVDRPADAARDHAIEVLAVLAGDTLRVTFRCSGELIDADRLAELADHYQDAVR